MNYKMLNRGAKIKISTIVVIVVIILISFFFLSQNSFIFNNSDDVPANSLSDTVDNELSVNNSINNSDELTVEEINEINSNDLYLICMNSSLDDISTDCMAKVNSDPELCDSGNLNRDLWCKARATGDKSYCDQMDQTGDEYEYGECYLTIATTVEDCEIFKGTESENYEECLALVTKDPSVCEGIKERVSEADYYDCVSTTYSKEECYNLEEFPVKWDCILNSETPTIETCEEYRADFCNYTYLQQNWLLE